MSLNYVDDIIVFSKDWELHLLDLEKAIGCLGGAGLKLNRVKCEFGRRFMEYLSHMVGSGYRQDRVREANHKETIVVFCRIYRIGY